MLGRRILPPIIEAAAIWNTWAARTWPTTAMSVLVEMPKIAPFIPFCAASTIGCSSRCHLKGCIHTVEAMEKWTAGSVAVSVKGPQVPFPSEPGLVASLCCPCSIWKCERPLLGKRKLRVTLRHVAARIHITDAISKMVSAKVAPEDL